MPAQILKANPEGSPQKLFLTVLEGEGALNNIRERDAREPVVQVTDENHKPVAGALVLFLVHDGGNGASATFSGAQSLSVTTGPDGLAHASGLQVGRSPGSYTISVSASVGAVVAEQVIIHQSNVITALNSTASTSATSASTGGSSTTSTVATHGIFHMSRLWRSLPGLPSLPALLLVSSSRPTARAQRASPWGPVRLAILEW